MPAIVLTFGHGGSKSQWQYNYGGLVYAKLGLACLAIDPLGEEERHQQGHLGTRAHDPKSVSDRADQANRLIMGKLVFDTMRGIDFLLQRNDIDPESIGVAGNSLGGAKAGWMAALEPRIKMAIVSGWAYDDVVLRTKYCTRLPNERMREQLSWTDYASLAAPDCTVLLANGEADWIIDQGENSVWERTRQVVSTASNVYKQLGSPDGIRAWFEAEGGHRPYFVYKQSLEWIHQHLGTPAMTLQQIRELPTVNSGQWCGTASNWSICTEHRCISAGQRYLIWDCVLPHVKSYLVSSPMSSARLSSRWRAGYRRSKENPDDCSSANREVLLAPAAVVHCCNFEFAGRGLKVRRQGC